MTKIDVTLCNRARLRAAEWAVWAADHKVKDKAHHILDVVWVNPETLEVYVDTSTVRQYDCWHFLEEADNRQLFNAYSEQHTNIWAQKFANANKSLIPLVPIRSILRGYGIHNLSSFNDDSEILNLFFHWLEGQGRKPDEVYEELWQKCHVALLSPSEWAAAEKYDEYEWDDEDDVEQDELLDHSSEDEQMVTFLRNQPVYNEVINRIEQEAYHMAVKTAMDAICTSFDYGPWLT